MPNQPPDPTPPDKGDFQTLNENLSNLKRDFSKGGYSPRGAPIMPEENTINTNNLANVVAAPI